MPVLDVPFVTELRPFEDLKLASGPRPSAEATASASPSPSAPTNTFMAMVSSVHFEELTEPTRTDDADSNEKGDDRRAKKTTKKDGDSAKDVDVRITLVANMLPITGDTGNSAQSALRCVALASHVFRARNHKDDNTTQGSSRTLETSLIVLKTPLLFSSEGSIRSISVLAHAVSSTDASSSKGPKTYRGKRQFMVRLLGVQQTTLTAEQVLLLASARK